jgi:hypothetical protein
MNLHGSSSEIAKTLQSQTLSAAQNKFLFNGLAVCSQPTNYLLLLI